MFFLLDSDGDTSANDNTKLHQSGDRSIDDVTLVTATSVIVGESSCSSAIPICDKGTASILRHRAVSNGEADVKVSEGEESKSQELLLNQQGLMTRILLFLKWIFGLKEKRNWWRFWFLFFFFIITFLPVFISYFFFFSSIPIFSLFFYCYFYISGFIF